MYEYIICVCIANAITQTYYTSCIHVMCAHAMICAWAVCM